MREKGRKAVNGEGQGTCGGNAEETQARGGDEKEMRYCRPRLIVVQIADNFCTSIHLIIGY